MRTPIVVAVVAFVVVACGDDEADKPLKEPKVHRAAAAVCPSQRGAGVSVDPSQSGAPASCHSDAECTEGTNGRCIGNGHSGYRCTYDACTTDDACGAGKLCKCREVDSSSPNSCLEASCRTDADCGAAGKGWCSPTLGSCGNYGGIESYQCHTAADECTDDAECGAGTGYCAFDKTVAHWKCSTSQCAG